MKSGDFISDELASKMVHDFRKLMTQIPEHELRETHAIHFDSSFIEEFILNTGAKGIKFYFALNHLKRMTLVLNATDAYGKDIHPINGFPHSNTSTSQVAEGKAGPIIALAASSSGSSGSGKAGDQGTAYP